MSLAISLLLPLSLISPGEALARAPPDPTPAQRAATPQSARGSVSLLRLVTRSLDRERLARDLALRSPEVRIVTKSPAYPSTRAAGVWGLAHIEPSPIGLRLVLFLSDGRAYTRDLIIESGQGERTAASVLSNLLAAIAEARVPADQEDVPMPDIDDEEEHATEPATPPTPPTPASLADPHGLVPEAAPPSTWRVMLYPATVFRLSGASRTVGAAAGVRIAAIVRGRAGVQIGLRIRQHAGPDQSRFRAAQLGVGAQYEWITRRIDVKTRAGIRVEPWRITREGQTVTLADQDNLVDPTTTLFGLGIDLVPCLNFNLGTADATAGLALGFSYAGVFKDGWLPVTVQPSPTDPSELFRVGGPEFSVAVELGLRLPRPP
ncbi:MAG: hypothetical protein V3V08_09960 [Nannocystaceae bacterium]